MSNKRKSASLSAKTFAQTTVFAGYTLCARVFGSIVDRTWSGGKDVPLAQTASHKNYRQYLSQIGNRKGMRVLEIGSREVTGKSSARQDFCNADYVGFDFYPGPNVDVVGDAHRLSQYFGEQRFHVIYSCAVFEHLAMPWVVASEIAKLLEPGGVVFVETHFSFKSHERPWHFFQFSDMALRVLFSPALGFECIDAGVSNPIVGRFSALADDYLRFTPVRTGLYCHVGFLGRKVKDVDQFDWNQVPVEDIVGSTKYPLKTQRQGSSC